MRIVAILPLLLTTGCATLFNVASAGSRPTNVGSQSRRMPSKLLAERRRQRRSEPFG